MYCDYATKVTNNLLVALHSIYYIVATWAFRSLGQRCQSKLTSDSGLVGGRGPRGPISPHLLIQMTWYLIIMSRPFQICGLSYGTVITLVAWSTDSFGRKRQKNSDTTHHSMNIGTSPWKIEIQIDQGEAGAAESKSRWQKLQINFCSGSLASKSTLEEHYFIDSEPFVLQMGWRAQFLSHTLQILGINISFEAGRMILVYLIKIF